MAKLPPASRRAAPPPAVSALIQSVMDEGGVLVAERIADRFKMSKQQLAQMLGVGGATFYKRARAKSPKTQERMRHMIEILNRVTEWSGGEAQAAAWYKSQPIPAFGGRTAESIVKSGHAGALRDYLDHLAQGGFA